jgi:hypothetical protein
MGIALIGAIMAHDIGDERTKAAFVDGFSTALGVAAAIAFVGAILSALLVRRHPAPHAGEPILEVA